MGNKIGIDFGVKEYTVAFIVHEKDGTITLKWFKDVKCRDPLTPEEKKKICENYSKKYKAEVRYDATSFMDKIDKLAGEKLK